MPPTPPGNCLHFLFSVVAFSAFSGKNSAQNLINYIKILTAIINSYQSCSNSNDPLNILHECCDTSLLMISFNYMSTKRGRGLDPLDPPPPPPPPICPWAYKEHVVEITETFNMPEVILQSTFSRILTFRGWPGWFNANGYKYAMLYLDANIKDACYSSKATLP